MHAARMLITLPCIHVPKTSKITSEVKYRKILFYRRSDRLAESANLNRISFANLNRISFFLPFPVKVRGGDDVYIGKAADHFLYYYLFNDSGYCHIDDAVLVCLYGGNIAVIDGTGIFISQEK